MTLPWRGTTPEISSEADSRYETPGGAQNKVNVSQEYLLHLLKLAVTGLSNGSEAAIARYSEPYGITYDWLKDRLDAADQREKNRNVFTIKDFGAVGDDATDNTTAINSAISQTSMAGGGVLIVPEGIFLAKYVNLKSNVIIRGQKKDSILKRIDFSGQTHFIIGDAVSNFEISDLLVDGNKTETHSYPYTDSINLIGCSNFTINNLSIKESVNRGMYIEKNTDHGTLNRSSVKNCTITTSESAAVQLFNCSDLDFTDTTVSYNVSEGVIINFSSARYSSNNLYLGNNAIRNNGQMGLWCYSDSVDRNTPIATLIIENTTVELNGFNGIISQINETILTNNVVRNNGQSPSLIGTGITINTSNATISGGSISGNDGAGIDLGDCVDILIQGVRIENNGVMGIEVNSCEEVLIDSCIIKGNNTTNDGVPFGSNNGVYVYQGTDGSGNPFSGNSKNVQIKNCIIRATVGLYQAYGVRVGVTAENVSLIGNDVYGSGNDGDFKIETAKCYMEGNISRGNGYDGNTLTAVVDLKIPPDGTTFFLESTIPIVLKTISTIENILPKGRKITLILTTTNITLFAGDGTNGNLINNSNADINGSYKIVEYISLGGTFPVWQQLTASSGR